MNNRECIDQVERGYRMAQPSHISYPESKTHAKELAVAQANVYKVHLRLIRFLYLDFYIRMKPTDVYTDVFFYFRLC